MIGFIDSTTTASVENVYGCPSIHSHKNFGALQAVFMGGARFDAHLWTAAVHISFEP